MQELKLGNLKQAVKDLLLFGFHMFFRRQILPKHKNMDFQYYLSAYMVAKWGYVVGGSDNTMAVNVGFTNNADKM